jgi:DNA-binding transcriptional LysR family regulator
MKINLRQIDAFQAAMEFGSATAASDVMHVTQPAVSRLISDLESTVGFQLFERRARGLVPTQDAHTLYEEVKRSFVGLERIGQVAGAIREKSAGSVRVIALSKYADGFVASITGRFVRDNTGIIVELESSATAGVVEGIISQSFDVGIASATISDPLIVTEPLFETSAILALPANDPLAANGTVPLGALDGLRMVVLPENSEYGTVIRRGLRQAKVSPEVAGIARTHASLCRMVQAGAGLALVDQTTAADFPAENGQEDAIVFRSTEPPITRTVAAILNARVGQSIATKSFLEALKLGVAATSS